MLRKSVAEVSARQEELLPAILPAKSRQELAPANNELTDRQRAVCDARLLIVKALEKVMKQGQFTRTKACTFLMQALYDGDLSEQVVLALAIGNDRNGFKFDVNLISGCRSVVPTPGQDTAKAANSITVKTLSRWLTLYIESDRNLNVLAPKTSRVRDMSVKPWMPLFLAEMQRPQSPSLARSYHNMLKVLPADVKVPSYAAVRRWYKEKYSTLDQQRGRNQGSALNPFKFCHTRTSEGMLPMDEIHSDGWNSKFTVPHPVSGKYVTIEVWHTRDVATRFVFPPFIGLSENTLVILGNLYNAIKVGGVPLAWQTDNTSSVKNRKVELDHAVSLQARLGFSIVHNIAGNSQANGIAEKFNQYLEACAKDLATYKGKDMDSLAQKQVHRITQKLVKAKTAEEARGLAQEASRKGFGLMLTSYQEAVDWVVGVCAEYNNMPHAALPKITDASGKRRNMTPSEAWAQHVADGWQPVALTNEDLIDSFRPHERKTVRRGRVRLFAKQDYHHADLDHHNGCEVQVAFDLYDGERCWIKTLDGVFICEATRYNPHGYRTISFLEFANNKRIDAAQARLERRQWEVAQQRETQLIEHEAPATLYGFGDLTRQPLARDNWADAELVDPVPRNDFIAAQAEEERDEISDMRPEERYALWKQTKADSDAGEVVPEKLTWWFGNYPTGSEYSAFFRREQQAREDD